jgi:DNA ligase-1
MSDDKPSGEVQFHTFDLFGAASFKDRIRLVEDAVLKTNCVEPVVMVPHILVNSREELSTWEAQWLLEGHEGVMIRSLGGPYKQGRSTEREGYLLKLKQFKDSEAIVLGSYEQMHNENEAKTNALGHTERSTEKAGMVPAGVLGGATRA